MPLFSIFQSPGVLRAHTGSETPLVLSGALGQQAPYFVIRDYMGRDVFFIDTLGDIYTSGTFVISGSTIAGDQLVSGNLTVIGSASLGSPVSLAGGTVVVSSAPQQVVFGGGSGAPVTMSIGTGSVSFLDSSGSQVLYADNSGNLEGAYGIDISPRTRTFTVECQSDMVIGDLVFIPAAGPAVRADGGNGALMPSAGVVIQKPTVTTAIVQVNGMVNDVFSGLTRGAVYYVGNNGQVSSSPPTGSVGTRVFSQRIGIAASTTSLILMISPDVFVFYR